MHRNWQKTISNTWFIFNDNLINSIDPADAEGVYVIFTNYNNIPKAEYVGKGVIKERLEEYTENQPMRLRRKITGSLYVTWASIQDANDQRNAEAFLIQRLNPRENIQRPVPHPLFTINLPW